MHRYLELRFASLRNGNDGMLEYWHGKESFRELSLVIGHWPLVVVRKDGCMKELKIKSRRKRQ